MNLKDFKNYYNKILIFYLPDKAGYWNSLTKCCISEKPVQLGRYYLDFSSKASYPGEFSNNGIPLSSYRGKPIIEHPTNVAQYALGIYEVLYQKEFKDEKLKNDFLKMAYWFVENGVNVKGGKGWCINILLPEFGLNSPWLSALTQGETISVLSRAAYLTDDNNFEQLANEALGPFEYEVKDGGLVGYFNSIPVYEEYPTPFKTSCVLNGFIFSLFGMFDLILLNNNSKAEKLFNKGIDSVKKILEYFELGRWSGYNLYEYPQKYYSSYTYHILMVGQLKALFFLTNDKYFLEYSERWKKYSLSFFNKTFALIKKLTRSNKVIY
jgi:hypothetical protein